MSAGSDRDTAGAIPRTEDAIDAAAAALGLTISAECMPGVIANLALLAGHAETLMADEAQ